MKIQDLREKNLIIFEAIVGSQSYGIATPSSDVDIKGVFIQPLDDILSFGYVEQVSDETNDTTFYEIRRFLQLLQTNNPTVLELLNTPPDCIVQKDPIFEMVLENKKVLITKLCKNSFGGYAVEQIKKARGLNKKIVKRMEKVRKSVLDFCYVPYGQGSLPVEEFLEKFHPALSHEDIGLSAIDHMRYTYGAYIRSKEAIKKHGYFKGIVSSPLTSNDVSLSDTERHEIPSFIVQFNKDGYSTYCREYKEYWDWVEKRNPQRYADNMLHEGGFDGKNLAHCHRLLDMAIEIGEGKGIQVRRPNREHLLSIRRGEIGYDRLISEAEEKIKRMEEAFEKSSLPESVDPKFVDQLLLRIRKRRYGLDK